MGLLKDVTHPTLGDGRRDGLMDDRADVRFDGWIDEFTDG
uniref:Uncharacterized protein n=1 Tax=Physcomitrium patens TaxID=3218 RepID=A0A2K1J7L2_PHYPA|nr:hypothetical protein PHYPA_020618 [Physcomitrium patens]